MKEFRVNHDPNDTPNNYTPKMVAEFLKRGLNIHLHDVKDLEDDFKKKQRVLKVKNTKYFVMGGS